LRPQSTGPAADPCVLQGSHAFLGHVLSGGASRWTARNVSIGATAASVAARLAAPALGMQVAQTADFPSTGNAKARSLIGSFALDGDAYLGMVKQPISKELPVKVGF